MTYFFVLGNNPALSLAELDSVLACREGKIINKDLFVWETDSVVNPERLIKTLGGTVKIGVFDETLTGPKPDIAPVLAKIALESYTERQSKLNFGLSDYGDIPFELPSLGLSLKKRFKDGGLSCRFVTSREKNLSSVVVEQNKLLKGRGVELVLARSGQTTYVGHTLAVQAFKELSKRDFGRPARDDQSGMLPPKLAEIMINLAEVDSDNGLILDPFCGSGTVLQEALLMGFNNVAGTDLSPKAIEDTKENIAWLKENAELGPFKMNVFLKNAAKLSESFKAGSVSAIVTEPYLGPQRGWNDIKLVKEELETLYSQMLKESAKILVPHGRIVMVWPLFFGNKQINPDYYQYSIVEPLPEAWQADSNIKLTNRKTIVYGRAGQKVFREIVILEKK